MDDDLAPRGGDPYTLPLDGVQLYGEFGESWRVPVEENLFDTPFDHVSLPPSYPVYSEDLTDEIRFAAAEVCKHAGISNLDLLDACTVDVGLTGNPEMANDFTSAVVPRGAMRVVRPGSAKPDSAGGQGGAPATASGASACTVTSLATRDVGRYPGALV
jgi:hypothetical protein